MNKTKYGASLHSKKDREILLNAFDSIGFVPKLMSIHVSIKEDYDKIEYDAKMLSTYLSKAKVIKLMNQEYSEDGGNFWFEYRISEIHNIQSLSWSNESLVFLNVKFDSIAKMSNFICAYMYNQYDVAIQSTTRIDSFKRNYPGKSFSTIFNDRKEPIVDISNHWGRRLFYCGLEFIAAPLMWFGQEFNKIILLKDLRSSKFFLSGCEMSNYVKLELFDLYDDPEKIDNRNRQREFWMKFHLDEVAEKYNKENFRLPEWMIDIKKKK